MIRSLSNTAAHWTPLLLSLSIALSGCSEAAPQEPATQTQQPIQTGLNVWHWNVAGSVLHGGRITTGLIERMGDSIRNNNAEFVTVNEICRKQYTALISNLQGGGGSQWNTAESFARFRVMKSGASFNPGGEQKELQQLCGCNPDSPYFPTCTEENDYGLAIFYKNGFGSTESLLLEDDPNTGEDYWLLCGTSALLPHLRLCGTHVTWSPNCIARPGIGICTTGTQLNQIRSYLDMRYLEQDTVIVGGDFNVEPNDFRLDDWYTSAVNGRNNPDNHGRYHELDDNDICPGYGEITFEHGTPSHNLCGEFKKIDLFFVRAAQVSDYDLDSRGIPQTCDTNVDTDQLRNNPCSDHHKIDGYASLSVVP